MIVAERLLPIDQLSKAVFLVMPLGYVHNDSAFVCYYKAAVNVSSGAKAESIAL
jgi:hypothetical protein